MSLLTAPIVKNSHILTGIYLIFLKSVLESFEIPNLDLSEKILEAVIKLDKFLQFFISYLL